MKTVLFLCSGNYYRSRYAEIYFNWLARQQGLEWRAVSRGLALDGDNVGHMSSHTMSWLAQRGISSDEYRRLPLDVTTQDLADCHLIVAVKRTEHYPLMQQRFPDWQERVEYWEVHDLDCATPVESIPHLERAVRDLLARLVNERSP